MGSMTKCSTAEKVIFQVNYKCLSHDAVLSVSNVGFFQVLRKLKMSPMYVVKKFRPSITSSIGQTFSYGQKNRPV
jgi:hypothetical protein